MCAIYCICAVMSQSHNCSAHVWSSAYTQLYVCNLFYVCCHVSSDNCSDHKTYKHTTRIHTHTAHMNYTHICAVTSRVTIERCRTIVFMLSRLKLQFCGASCAVRGSTKMFLEIKRIKRCPLSSATRQNVPYAMFDVVFFGNQVP